MKRHLDLILVGVLAVLLLATALFQDHIDGLSPAMQVSILASTTVFVGAFVLFVFWRNDSDREL